MQLAWIAGTKQVHEQYQYRRAREIYIRVSGMPVNGTQYPRKPPERVSLRNTVTGRRGSRHQHEAALKIEAGDDPTDGASDK